MFDERVGADGGRHRGAGRRRDRQRAPLRGSAAAQPRSASAARERARGARRHERAKRDQGRVPRDAVARAAHAAQRDPRLDADPAHATPTSPTDCARPRGHRAQRARAGAAHRGPARHEPHHLGQAPARRAARRAAAPSSTRRSRRCGPRPTRRACACKPSSTRSAGPCHGDPNRLQQVVWNLLSNAVKFTPKGGRVQVVLARVNSHVEITRQRHRRGHRSRSSCRTSSSASASATPRRRASTAASGSAWRIVKQLVELHGGTVRAASDGDGRGATFVVALPLAIVHARARAVGASHPRTFTRAAGHPRATARAACACSSSTTSPTRAS